MRQRVLACFLLGIAALLGGPIVPGAAAADAPASFKSDWKVGVARVKITPEQSMWMAGYAARKKPSEGVAQELFAKALAVEDSTGRRVVIVTTDLIGIPRDLRKWMEEQVLAKYQLPRESLLLNASHTHCGPELRMQRVPVEGSAEEVEQRMQRALSYMEQLKAKLVALVGDALKSLEPARLDYLQARCGFAMNRRRPTDSGVTNSPHSDGPVDHQVPVLRVTGGDGKVRALLFGYACHNTTLPFYFFCGDYAGFAQQYLEESRPGTTALFFMGCGGDQNPYPRGQIERAQQHGRTLATAVEAALETVPRPVRGTLRLAYDEIPLAFAPPPSREGLLARAEAGKEPEASHARRLLKQLETDGKIRDEYSYPIQVVAFGQDWLVVALAGETVIDYSLRIKRELAHRNVWVAGYSNDVFGYVPSRRVLEEGGYEAGGAMLWGSLPGPFAPDVEDRIMKRVLELTK